MRRTQARSLHITHLLWRSNVMAVILIILAAAVLILVGWYGFRFYQERLEQRMCENEYDTAVVLWEFAKRIKGEIDQAMRGSKGILDFTNITVPSSDGY